MMSKYLFATCVAAVSFGVALATPAAAQDKITLKLADYQPVTNPVFIHGGKVFMKTVTDMTKGRVQFEHYPAEQLGKMKDMLSLAQSGVADISVVVLSTVSEKMPSSTVMELPGLFGSSCEGTKAFMKIGLPGGALGDGEFKSGGVRVLLPFVYQPYSVLTTKQKVEKIDDWKGLKIRVAGGATELALTHFGAVPVRIGSPDIYQSLSRGTIDGTLFVLSAAKAYDLDSIVKYVTSGFSAGNASLAYFINQRSWDKLPADVQKVLEDAGKAAALNLCEQTDRLEGVERENMRKKGIVITQLGKNQIELWNKRLAPVMNEWVGKLKRRGIDAPALYNAVAHP